jgi:hypothetical protein
MSDLIGQVQLDDFVGYEIIHSGIFLVGSFLFIAKDAKRGLLKHCVMEALSVLPHRTLRLLALLLEVIMQKGPGSASKNAAHASGMSILAWQYRPTASGGMQWVGLQQLGFRTIASHTLGSLQSRGS